MFRGESFVKVFHLSGVTAGGSGASYDSPLPFVDGDLWAIPAGTLIEDVFYIIDTVITGTTVLEVGDDDDPNGFVLDAAANFGTTGLYASETNLKGDYLKAAGADANDNVAQSKFYAAAGKELKLNITTANTAGRMRVVVKGHFFPEV